MTKQLTYTGTFRQSSLMDELLITFPEWVIGEGDGRQCLLYLEGNEQGVRLTVPDNADEEAIGTVILAHDPEAPTARETLRNNIKAIAQSAAGIRLNDLTAAQSRALVAILLWKAGGVAPDMTIKPLGDWT
jgi:hypothetical protein